MSRVLDITPEHLVEVQRLLRARAPRPATVWAFGSRVLGTATAYSDLDLAIDAGRRLSWAEQADLQEAFEEAALPFRVDIVDWATVSQAFRDRVTSQRIPLMILPAIDPQAPATTRAGS